MRLSSFIGARVYDENDREIGHVTDVRLEQSGPVIGSFGSAFRVQGFIVGKRSFAGRLGYDRSEVRGPWLVKAVVDLLQRDARFVPWDRVAALEERKLRITGTSDSLRSPQKLGALAAPD